MKNLYRTNRDKHRVANDKERRLVFGEKTDAERRAAELRAQGFITHVVPEFRVIVTLPEAHP